MIEKEALVQQMENNNVILQGKVTSEPRLETVLKGDEGIYIFTLEIKRKSDVVDNVIVRVSNLISNFDNIKQDSFIEIHGSLRTRRKNGRVQLSVFCETVTVLARDVDTKDNNRCRLTGIVNKEPIRRRTIHSDRIICELMLAIEGKRGKKYNIPCIVWGRYADYASVLKVGDTVTLEGRLQSRVYYKNNESVEVHEISVDYIGKVD